MTAEIKMQVRIPSSIRDALAKDAKNNHRSMNGQLIAILSEHFRTIRLDFETDDAANKGPDQR
jgi:hypothetical protein